MLDLMFSGKVVFTSSATSVKIKLADLLQPLWAEFGLPLSNALPGF